MNATTVIAIGLLLWIGVEVVALWTIRRSRKKFRCIRHLQDVRHRFASARQKLFSLVLKGELDSRSATFRGLYQMHTFILRRPDEYDKIQYALTASLYHGLTEGKADFQFAQEALDWNAGIKSVVRDTADALALVVIDYCRQYSTFWMRQQAFWETCIGRFCGFCKGDDAAAQETHKSLPPHGGNDPFVSVVSRVQRDMLSLTT